MSDFHTGSCLCGKVRLKISGPMRSVVACHCTQCRKQSGHYYAATNVPDDALEVAGMEHVKWFQSSEEARRGFCQECGSALFWKKITDDFTSVLAGCLDKPTGLQVAKHIFVADKGDYYAITDGLPQS